MNPDQMKRHIISGRSKPTLGYPIAATLGETLVEHAVETFPDGEVYVCIETDLMATEKIFVTDSLCCHVQRVCPL